MAEVFVTTQKLRFCDTDRLGHVNNAIYSVMCEAGRAELMQVAALFGPESGHGIVIARLELDFRREMTWPGEIRIDTAIDRIGHKSLHVRQHLHQGEVLVARAASVLAVIDTETRRAVPITPAWHAALARWVVAGF